MMNQVAIIGRLVRDPEQVVTKGGTEMTTFSIAVDGRKDEVSYFDCKSFGKTAELVARYKSKGEQVGVTGRLVQERWEAQDGQKRSAVRIIAEQVTFIGAKAEGKPFAEAAAAAGFTADEDIPF
jgi:single-strand DNA-binding protein